MSQSPPLVETFYAKLLSDYDASNTLFFGISAPSTDVVAAKDFCWGVLQGDLRTAAVSKDSFLGALSVLSVASSIPEAKRVVITDLKGQFSNMLLTLESFEREQSRLSELVDGHTRILARIREKNVKSKEL